MDVRPEAELGSYFNGESSDILFYDIETTGLSPEKCMVYMVGTACREGDSWVYRAFFVDSEEEEPLLLSTFGEVLKKFSTIIQYNGNAFDRPFILKRCALLGIDFPVTASETDLFRELAPVKKLLSLASMKQKSLEQHLGVKREYPDGKNCIKLFRAWQKDHDPIKQKMLIGHNREDVGGLISITRCISYLQLFSGEYSCTGAVQTPEELMLEIKPFKTFPAEFIYNTERIKLQGSVDKADIIIPIKNGKIRHYYPDFKNYDYLPNEDNAVPKSIGKFVDRTLKTSAKPETCYTWIKVTEEFLKNAALQEKYLKQTLPVLLKL